ncbi:20932_t:CDS:2, partial [Gigaspora rosea]
MGSHIQLISSLTSLPFKEWLTNLFVVILLYIAKYYYTYFTRRNPLPGPFPFPLIGNIHLFHGELDNVFFKLQAKYGEMFEVFIGSERKIWLGNAKLIKKINDPSPKSNFPIRAKGSWINDMRVTDKGIGLNTNLNSWRNNRMMVTKSIMVPSFLRQFVQEVEKFFDELDEYWLVSGNELDFSKWIYKFENDLIIHTFTRKKTCAMAIYHNYISSHNHTTSHLENELRQSEELVYEEIDRIFCDDKTRPITYDDIIKMTYTEACIKESLRMIPIAPFLYKSSIKEDTIGGLNWKEKDSFGDALCKKYYISNDYTVVTLRTGKARAMFVYDKDDHIFSLSVRPNQILGFKQPFGDFEP